MCWRCWRRICKGKNKLCILHWESMERMWLYFFCVWEGKKGDTRFRWLVWYWKIVFCLQLYMDISFAVQIKLLCTLLDAFIGISTMCMFLQENGIAKQLQRFSIARRMKSWDFSVWWSSWISWLSKCWCPCYSCTFELLSACHEGCKIWSSWITTRCRIIRIITPEPCWLSSNKTQDWCNIALKV